MTKDNIVALCIFILLCVGAIVFYIVNKIKDLKSSLSHTNNERDRLYKELLECKHENEQYQKNAAIFADSANKEPYIRKLHSELVATRDKKMQLENDLYALEQKYTQLKKNNPSTYEVYKKPPRDLTYQDYALVISENSRLKAEVQEQTEATQNAENRLTALTNEIAQIRNNNFFKSHLCGTMIMRDLHSLDVLHRNKRIHLALNGHCKIVSASMMSCKIQGERGIIYDTSFDSCSCPDFQNSNPRSPCKHMYFLAIELGQFLTISSELEKSELSLKLRETISQEEHFLEAAKRERKAAEKAKREQETFLQKKAELLKKIDCQLKISLSKEQTFPYLSSLFARLEEEKALIDIDYLKNKPRPAFKSAQEIEKTYKNRNKKLSAENEALKSQLDFLEFTFPWLEEFRQLPPEDAYTLAHNTFQASSEFEYLSPWISAEEWKKLSTVQRYQTVLDRYNDPKRKRSDWEIGRDYERYVGYQYETQGFRVQYFGATQKLEDLGRDVIASNADNTYIIQCKYWREERTVREKHIFQLYGTLIMYRLEHPEATNVQGLFVTSCTLSDTAKQVAEYLHIVVKENFRYSRDYPMIKCNISEATGEKIYHLPCDLQYDKVVIEKEKGEFYASTVAEAESAGFRRAKKFFAQT